MTDGYIQKVLDGDSEAFRFIIKEYKDKAYSIAFSVVKDELIAREAAQDAFIKAYTKLHKFKGDSRFSTWLYRIVVNEALKTQKKYNRKAKLLAENVSINASPIVNDGLLKLKNENQHYYINETLKKLSPNYSLALRLFYLEDYKIQEISNITGWTDANTKVILHRARNKMKEMLSHLFNLKKEDLY